MTAFDTNTSLDQAAPLGPTQLALVAVILFDGEAAAILVAAASIDGTQIAELAVAVAVDHTVVSVSGAQPLFGAAWGAAAAFWVAAQALVAIELGPAVEWTITAVAALAHAPTTRQRQGDKQCPPKQNALKQQWF